ncbi:hypothetical protein Zmor_021883 [Zophobas morio]|uniref:Reverse transcriptase domain-containing protein n=1 Tax=Zophobas morio TaxID=2755281 RepID=A0AA38I784_9CUCU|nr:hypothetical protein Zmor_021883 [Zophobas morio]
MQELAEKKIPSYLMAVPQGFILRPTLWNLQYDSILNTTTEDGIKFVVFADDLAILVTGESKKELERKANRIINKVSKALENKKLPLAPEKADACSLQEIEG